jgi:hypothetical protein
LQSTSAMAPGDPGAQNLERPMKYLRAVTVPLEIGHVGPESPPCNGPLNGTPRLPLPVESDGAAVCGLLNYVA